MPWTSLHARIWPQISMDQEKDAVRSPLMRERGVALRGTLGRVSPFHKRDKDRIRARARGEKVRNWENELTPH